MYNTLFFDLDNTLYPADSGLWEAIGLRIESFLKNEIKMQEEEITTFRLDCRKKYGTALQGLKHLYQVDDAYYLKYVHDVNLSDYLRKDGRLSALLDSLPQRKIVFTNSDINHARNVLGFLDVERYFEFIIDVNQQAPYVKPQKESFSKALELAGLKSADGCVFLDDHLPSVQNAADMGFLGVLIGEDAESDYPYQIADIFRLPEILK
ncbi:pyrimidine 5'-nucleotidase [Pelolinea submarina]|uniref:Putative hydrolase of the HAD superfamily/pyrimidine and pyridine-specific 5'-nucleotidase n=1 Tax=Pelolinea submarina TaxID=913107 RepID=A0A347ZSN7_9CHLR|nr:pyrimidine 5'-nucleotidase [Pelolinea submarina]REG11109.1 putative hydrolase of the HAD superfamily/pyrimidine and pyridine-specific 5'-nucleotidase [Pelolinea submarina]BBB48318.1 HAD-superfamily hydrolase [Pelolinea submarina]